MKFLTTKIQFILFKNAGKYDITLTITSPQGCKNTLTINDMITVYKSPNARFLYNPLYPSVVDGEVVFTNLSEYADWYIWSFGDGDSSIAVNPYHVYRTPGSYTVELLAMTQLGCKDTARSTITIRDEYTFYAPTYISPDFDGINDVFFVIGHGITSKDFKMHEIYDRWGEIIYETDKYDPTDPQKYGWNGTTNGKLVPVGTYTWLVRYTDLSNTYHEKTGSVTVIR